MRRQPGSARARALTGAIVFAVAAAAAFSPFAGAEPLATGPFAYATYLGGSSDDQVFDVSLAPDGGILAAGTTASVDFGSGLPGVRDRGSGNDAFVAKLSPDGADLEWVAVLGGAKGDSFASLAVASNGDILVAGSSFSRDFPVTEGAVGTVYNGSPDSYSGGDAVVVRLSGDGTSVRFSTYVGGESHDSASSVGEREDGAVVVAGTTNSHAFPTTEGAFDNETNAEIVNTMRTYTPFDGFITVISADGEQWVYSTVVGGWNNDHIEDLAVGPGLNVTVAGFTESDDFPRTPAATGLATLTGQRIGVWAFVMRLNETGSATVYSGAVPATGATWGYALALDPEGGVFVAGNGYGVNVTDGAFNTTQDQYANQTFVVHINADATEMTEATWLGPEGYIRSLTLTDGGGVAVGLSTYAHNFPTTMANASGNNYEGYVGVLSCDLGELAAGTYIGGSSDDFVRATGQGANGTLIVGGSTGSTDFPLTGGAADNELVPVPVPRQGQPGSAEGFVGVLDPGPVRGPHASVAADSARANVSTAFAFDASGSRVICGPPADLEYRWDFDGDGAYDTGWSETATANHSFDDPGTYNVTVQVQTPDGDTDSAVFQVRVTSEEGFTAPQVTYNVPARDTDSAVYHVRLPSEVRFWPPPVTPSRPARVSAPGGEITLTATVDDPDEVAAVTLVYRTVGSSVFANASMVRAGGSEWTGTALVPDGAAAIEYYFVAVDSVGDSSRSPEEGTYAAEIVQPPTRIDTDISVVFLVAVPAAAAAALFIIRLRRRGQAR